MRVRFWGARGSLAKPGRSTLRYGGNTSCVEVRTAAGTLIIIDCGTGVHGLGQALVAEKPSVKGHILISHTHWDHIQGIPFFAPFFIPKTEWDIYGPKGIGQSLRESLAGQMQYAYFPVALDQLDAKIRYHELIEGTFQIDDVAVRTQYLNHPALTFAYRLEADGVAIVYASDHEPHSQHLATGRGQMLGEDLRHCEFLTGADLVIHDAQYTADEYPSKVGWGHSTVEYALAVCRTAGVKRLALTHHDPLRSDDALDRLVEKARADLGDMARAPEVFAATEGQTLNLRRDGRASTICREGEPAIADGSAMIEPVLLLGIEDPVALERILEAAGADAIKVVETSVPEHTMRAVRSSRPSLIILERRRDGIDALDLCSAIRRSGDDGSADVPIIVVGDAADLDAGKEAGVTDWLVTPFSSAYARTRIQAWLFRTACRWERAPLPEDEEQRLATLHSLDILDTPQEQRFDRLTRIAAAILDVPVALISLVDKDRQWFKSVHGLERGQTPREVSFCAHAVALREMLIVPDALHDTRFADNPMVTGEPRVRFYAGFPLFFAGSCIGTLCVCDTRPRYVDSGMVGLLRDVAALAEIELQRIKRSQRPAGSVWT